VIHLKDIVKGGIKERFIELRRMGIKTVMITGDNPLTAAAIAADMVHLDSNPTKLIEVVESRWMTPSTSEAGRSH
jgi:P-type E1-E2 ATPase